MTLIEILISIAVMTIAMVMFSGVVSSTTRMGGEKRRASIAAHAARSQLETMRCQQYDLVFALYNASGLDDPNGPNTAPGANFAVAGLDPLDDDADGCVGRIEFADAQGKLLESTAHGELGLPRDLNGDTLIDDLDHAGDYAILPVKVRLDWKSEYGPRKLEMFTMIVQMGSE
jgi:type II secretory pathway pseudopilin PulG